MDAPAVPAAEAMRFRAELWTRWVDEDNQAVLNNAVYLTLLEEARHRYFSSLGLLEGNQFPFLLLQCNVRYLRPGRGGVAVVVETATTRLGNSSFEQAYRVRPADGGDAQSEAQGEPWCEAVALLVCVDEQGRSTPMTDAFRRAIGEREGLSG